MLVDDGLCFFAALVELREDLAFLNFVEGDIKTRACQVGSSNLKLLVQELGKSKAAYHQSRDDQERADDGE